MHQDWVPLEPMYYGNDSDVFKVRLTDGTIRAVKYIKIPVQLGEQIGGRLRQIEEKCQRMMGLGNNPYLVQILDVQIMERDAQVAQFVELVEGKPLETIIKEREKLQESAIRYYCRQILEALKYLHSKKVIHRNISSCSIIVRTGDNAIKMFDFGMSVQLEDVSSHPTYATRGLPYYQAPEVLDPNGTGATQVRTPTTRGSHFEDTGESEGPYRYWCQSDIWALGCIVYEMATGNRPYADCRNMNDLVTRVIRDGAPPLPVAVSPALRDFYSKCTEPNRYNRESAERLLEHPFITQQGPAAARGPVQADQN